MVTQRLLRRFMVSDYPDLYTIDQAADALGLSRVFVRKEVASGALPVRADGFIDANVLELYEQRLRASQREAMRAMSNDSSEKYGDE
jgi:hypothetical protein